MNVKYNGKIVELLKAYIAKKNDTKPSLQQGKGSGNKPPAGKNRKGRTSG